MALLTNGAQNLGSYYCLIRRRFKRRRKKRSERKGAVGARLLSGQIKTVAMDVDEEENMSSSSTDVKENRNLDNVSCKDGVGVAEQLPNGSGLGSRKRPLEEGNNGHTHSKFRAKKRKKTPGPILPKNALMQLNEINLVYSTNCCLRRDPYMHQFLS
ncbi:hypothetical protein KUCAC02_010015 [Chaenocephalus aceratus]|uniref:Uncharacterized protein n=1 Tax=Chaenocephalus aceratus TaxID=36190 RepID=A0ACB9VZ24_CHAAC|nr:hypothetical protein KUCAC02_010015 [Chaenocephalus aceratus]